MLDRPAVIYHYDGTFAGFLSCVFESYAEKEMPIAILPADESDQTSLFGAKYIETDLKRAQRVRTAVPQKLGLAANELLEHGFLTNMAEKELTLLKFLRMGFKRMDRRFVEDLTDPVIHRVTKAVNGAEREAHLYLGFVRFSDCGGVLIAQIEPKNAVLPLIAPHFLTRFSGEHFMIFDRTHKTALVGRYGEPEFLYAEKIELPEFSPEEQAYRGLWKLFYDTVEIEARRNPLCRRSHMPKRYWAQMTEMGDASPSPSTQWQEANLWESKNTAQKKTGALPQSVVEYSQKNSSKGLPA